MFPAHDLRYRRLGVPRGRKSVTASAQIELTENRVGFALRLFQDVVFVGAQTLFQRLRNGQTGHGSHPIQSALGVFIQPDSSCAYEIRPFGIIRIQIVIQKDMIGNGQWSPPEHHR